MDYGVAKIEDVRSVVVRNREWVLLSYNFKNQINADHVGSEERRRDIIANKHVIYGSSKCTQYNTLLKILNILYLKRGFGWIHSWFFINLKLIFL